MEKIKHLFLLLLIIIAFFIPGMSKEKEYYEIYFYLNNYSTYPGEEIPVSLQGYYYYLSKNSDFTEKVTFKIYKLPPDLTHDKYEDYCKKNKPVREFKKDITMKKSGEYWYGYETFKIPPMEIGSYYIIASTEKAKYGYEVHVGKLGLSAKSSKDNIIIFLQDKKTGNLLSNIDVSLHINKETKKYKTDKNGFVNVNIKELENAKPGDNLKIIAERDNDRVELNISLPGQEAFLKGYIYTDRPVYRPDQKVYFKGTMRLGKRDTNPEIMQSLS